jgi:hypothetical protein
LCSKQYYEEPATICNKQKNANEIGRIVVVTKNAEENYGMKCYRWYHKFTNKTAATKLLSLVSTSRLVTESCHKHIKLADHSSTHKNEQKMQASKKGNCSLHYALE